MQKELDIALDLALRAGEEILRVRDGAFDVEQKCNDEGPVTVADRRADHLIRTGLTTAFPNDALLTEESPDDLVRLRHRRVWIVDPLDGTQQFVQKGTEFAVMIGLAVAGRAVLGVVHLPCEGLTYVGGEEFGAREIDARGRERVLQVDPDVPRPDRLRVTVSRSHLGQKTRRLLELLQPAEVVPSGSVGRKAALVAAGRVDLYISMGSRSRHWDACAPEAIVRAAGGAFLDARGGTMTYNTVETRNRSGLLACRRGLVVPVVAAVEAVYAQRERGDLIDGTAK